MDIYVEGLFLIDDIVMMCCVSVACPLGFHGLFIEIYVINIRNSYIPGANRAVFVKDMIVLMIDLFQSIYYMDIYVYILMIL